jgi:membrane-bound lytic murein transglycosylase C
MSRLRRAVSLLLVGCPLFLGSDYLAADTGYNPGDSGFAAFKDDVQQGFASYRDQVQKEAREFAKLNEQISSSYESRIADVWADPEQSSSTRWVLYDDNYKRKRVVDFEKEVITWSAPGRYANQDFGLAEARTMLADLMSITRRQAFEQDEVASEVESKSRAQFEHLETAELDNKSVLPAFMFGDSEVGQSRIDEAIDAMLASAEKIQLTQKEQSVTAWTFPIATSQTVIDKPNVSSSKKKSEKAPVPQEPRVIAAKQGDVWRTKFIGESQLKLLPARARPFVSSINRENAAFDLSAELLLAIMETESAFNPMAKSPIPAFGLMQIVPASAGQDATEKLFGKPRLLAPSFLYNPENNIQVGAAYFNILYYRYFRGIENPLTRLYCAVAAYNTGPGNVSKALTGSSMALKPAIRVANTMSPSEIYSHLLSNLPYEETVNYLRKVVSRLAKYEEALSGG